jgi:hypothetical protein
VQQSSTFDFIRTIAAVFKPHAIQVPTYTVEDGRMLTETIDCRLATTAFQDVVGTAAQEATMRSLRAQKDREVVTLQEALQKQKDESLLEMVELHTQNENLKHNLGQAEQALLASRRAFKDERDLLVAKLRQYEAERDVRLGSGGRMPAGPPQVAASWLQASNYSGGGGGGSAGGGGGASYAVGPPQQQQPQQQYGSQSPGGGGGSRYPPQHGASPAVWGSSSGHPAAGGPSPIATSHESLELSHAGVPQHGYSGAYNASTPGLRPAAASTLSEAPFASPAYRSGGLLPPPTGSWGGSSSVVAQQQPSSAGAYGGAGRSPRAAFEHLEKTLSDGERFLANTQRRGY